jgi:5-methylcytosine-specific restriction endonuclease McrA
MARKAHPREHGTMKGYRQHQKPYAANEEICQPCKDARAKHMQKYRKDNPEIMKAFYKRKWARADKELVNQKNREWRSKNREHANAYQRDLRKNNPRFLELHNATSRRRRARIRSQGFEFFSETDIINKYGTNCHLCNGEIDLNAPRQARKKGPLGQGWEKGLHIDHVVPIALGGSDTLDNVRPAHAFCNLSKGAKISGNKKNHS